MKHKINKHRPFSRDLPVKMLLISVSLLFALSCTQKRSTDRAFYYWRTILSANEKEMGTLKELKAKRLYVKFYDVIWDERNNRPDPVAKIQITPNALNRIQQDSIEVIPVVFITNDCLKRISPDATDELSERINYLLAGMLNNAGITRVTEIQLDCDWTEETRDKYFALLKYIKTLPLFINNTLSATIRLYQCKYKEKTGIPPVNRGLLMCYNMGNLKASQTGNSILDTEEMLKYTAQLKQYPLPLDIALPIFEWKVLFRKDQFYALITNLPDHILADSGVARTDGNYRELLMDTVLYGYPLKKGDRIRTEKSNYAEIEKAAKAISPLISTPRFTISLFHLDSALLTQYKPNELESIYRSFDQ
jgi:hypothetical protein